MKQKKCQGIASAVSQTIDGGSFCRSLLPLSSHAHRCGRLIHSVRTASNASAQRSRSHQLRHSHGELTDCSGSGLKRSFSELRIRSQRNAAMGGDQADMDEVDPAGIARVQLTHPDDSASGSQSQQLKGVCSTVAALVSATALFYHRRRHVGASEASQLAASWRTAAVLAHCTALFAAADSLSADGISHAFVRQQQ